MRSRRITLADAVNVTGLTRHQLRNLLNELPEFKDRQTAPRVAHAYSKQDLLVIAICAHLESALGMRREVIGALSPRLREALSRPRSIHSGAYLLIAPGKECGIVLPADQSTPQEGILLDCGKIQQRLDDYLLDEQRSFALPPVAVGQEPNGRAVRALARASR